MLFYTADLGYLSFLFFSFTYFDIDSSVVIFVKQNLPCIIEVDRYRFLGPMQNPNADADANTTMHSCLLCCSYMFRPLSLNWLMY